MGVQLDPDDGVDRRAARIASRQRGIIVRRQALALGIGRGGIAHRVEAGRWHVVHRGVYAIGHPALTEEGRWLAAVLAFGVGAVLSHDSAGRLWGIRRGTVGETVHVSLDTRAGRCRAGIVLHRARLPAQDVARRGGIPVTSAARTLCDLAPQLTDRALVRALRESQFQRILSLTDLEEVLSRRPNRRLRRLVDDLTVTQTELEDRLLALCAARSLPRPLTQQQIHGRRVDFLWPRERLVVETDGWQAHATRDAFQTDRALTNTLQLSGYTILRFTYADLKRRPGGVARQIRAALAPRVAPSRRR